MTPAESLARWGTVAFSAEVMEPNIRWGSCGVLELAIWISLVPQAYRDDAMRAALDVFERMLADGGLANEESRVEFISRLLDEVRRIPRRPVAMPIPGAGMPRGAR